MWQFGEFINKYGCDMIIVFAALIFGIGYLIDKFKGRKTDLEK